MGNSNPSAEQAQPNGVVRTPTHGESRVRISFNPNDDITVNQIKTLSANLIDFCHEIKDRDPRLAALAETAFEQACMWAVKLATTPEPTEPKK